MKKLKEYILLFSFAFVGTMAVQGQITKTLGIVGVDELYAREFVCVLYDSNNKVKGVLTENLTIEAFDENKIDTYARFELTTKLDNSLLLKNIKGYVTRDGSGLKYRTEEDFEKAFKRKENAAAGDVYVVKDNTDRNSFRFEIVDKAKESGYIGLEKPMLSESKLRLYIVK